MLPQTAKVASVDDHSVEHPLSSRLPGEEGSVSKMIFKRMPGMPTR